MNEAWHDQVTTQLGGKENYGRGIWPNPFVAQVDEYRRRQDFLPLLNVITQKIEMLTEPRFVTGTETSELIESLVTMVSAKRVLEVGMHVGRTSLHILRALVGKPGAVLVSVDARPSHDRQFFSSLSPWFQFLPGWTPDCLREIDVVNNGPFDFVFVDSDHSLEHSERELHELMRLTRPGSMFVWHDVPMWQTPTNLTSPPIRLWLQSLIGEGKFQGLMLPSPRQLDCVAEWGTDYPTQCSPGLAVMIRN